MPLKASIKMYYKDLSFVIGRIACDNASKKHIAFGCCGIVASNFIPCFGNDYNGESIS